MDQTETKPPSRITLASTVEEAKNWLRDRLTEGDRCPVCKQHCKIYRRKITSSMVTTAAKVRRAQDGPNSNDGYVYLPDIFQHSRDFATMAYFGLAGQAPGKRIDGGRPGWWRITEDGMEFLRGNKKVHKYALIYNGARIGYDGEEISVREIAPEFRFDELMAGV